MSNPTDTITTIQTPPNANGLVGVLQSAVSAIDSIFGEGYARENPALIVAIVQASRPSQVVNNNVRKYVFGDDDMTAVKEALALKQ